MPAESFVITPGASRAVERRPRFLSRQSFNFGGHWKPGRDGPGRLRVFNDDRVEGGGSIPMHPHAGVQILSVMLSGAMHHLDNLGNAFELGPGDIKVMHTGDGLEHGGRCAGQTRFLQIWLDGAAGRPQVEVVHPKLQTNAWVTVAAPSGAPIRLDHDVWCHRGRFTQGVKFSLPHRGARVFAMTVEGALLADGVRVMAGDSLELDARGTAQARPRLEALAELDLFVIEQGQDELTDPGVTS